MLDNLLLDMMSTPILFGIVHMTLWSISADYPTGRSDWWHYCPRRVRWRRCQVSGGRRRRLRHGRTVWQHHLHISQIHLQTHNQTTTEKVTIGFRSLISLKVLYVMEYNSWYLVTSRNTCNKKLYGTFKQNSYQARHLWTGNIHTYCQAVDSGAITILRRVCRYWDSNTQPSACGANALTNCATTMA